MNKIVISSPIFIYKDYLVKNTNHYFIFGDNLHRIGNGGAAKLRHIENTYGFITKKKPNNNDDSYYKPDEYIDVFEHEFEKLKLFCNEKLLKDKNSKFLLSAIGAGLANKHNIFENVIFQI